MAFFPNTLQKFLYKRTILKVSFENGIKEFRGIFFMSPDNSIITVSNSSKIYPPFPFLKLRNFYFEIVKPSIGLTTLMNYYEFEEDYSISFEQQFEIRDMTVEIDNQFYGIEESDYKLYVEELASRLNEKL